MKNQRQSTSTESRIHWSRFVWLFTLPILYQLFYSFLVMFFQEQYPMQENQKLPEWFESHFFELLFGVCLILGFLMLLDMALGIPKAKRFQMGYIHGLKWGGFIAVLSLIFGIGESILSSEVDNILSHLNGKEDILEKADTWNHQQMIDMQLINMLSIFLIWIRLIQNSLAQILPPKAELLLLALSASLYFPIDQLHQILPNLIFSAWIFVHTRSFILAYWSCLSSVVILLILAFSQLKIEGYNELLGADWQPIWFDIIGIFAVVIPFYLLQLTFDHLHKKTKDSMPR